MRQLRFGVVVFGALVGCKPAEVAGAVLMERVVGSARLARMVPEGEKTAFVFV